MRKWWKMAGTEGVRQREYETEEDMANEGQLIPQCASITFCIYFCRYDKQWESDGEARSERGRGLG